MKAQKEPGKRILLIGVSGSGKTSMASLLASLLNYPHIELDSLYWEEGWLAGDPEIVQERFKTSLAQDSWVADGNYSSYRELSWSRADTIIWLDYNLLIIFWRLFKRTVGRLITREKLWNKNRESFITQFLSKDSLFLWALKTYFRYRLEYEQLLQKPEHKDLTVFRFKSPLAAERWLKDWQTRI